VGAERRILNAVKGKLPKFFRYGIGMVLTYFRRVVRWAFILRLLRGETLRDSAILFASACAAPITSFRKFWVWQDPVLLWDCQVRVVETGSFNLRARTDDLWHVYPDREPEVFAQISALLRPRDVFVDAGANIGVYTVLASRKVGASGRVLAIEMMPETCAILRKHLEMNGCENAEVIETALSDAEGEFVDAFLPRSQCGQASLTRNPDKSEKIRVQTRTLDRVAAEIDRVRLLKLDLEGVELQALQGARKLLDRVDAICFEDREGDSPVRPFLQGLGFSLSPLGKADVFAERRLE